MSTTRLSLALRGQPAVPAGRIALKQLRPHRAARHALALRRDARHPVRGAVLLQRGGAAAERWGWPGVAALACSMVSLGLWAFLPAPGPLTLPAPAAGVVATSPVAPVERPDPQAADAAQRLQDLEALSAWFHQQGLQWRAATYHWADGAHGASTWTVEAQLRGTPEALEAAMARLPRDFAHLQVDELRLSQGPGHQLQARARLLLRYRANGNP